MCAICMARTHFLVSSLRVKAEDEGVAGGAAGGSYGVECEVWQDLEVHFPLDFRFADRPIYITLMVVFAEHSVVDSVNDFHFVADPILQWGSLLLDMVDTYEEHCCCTYRQIYIYSLGISSGRALKFRYSSNDGSGYTDDGNFSSRDILANVWVTVLACRQCVWIRICHWVMGG